MATVNPRLLEQQEQKPTAPSKRAVVLRKPRSITAITVIGSVISSLLDRKVLKVQVNNEQEIRSSISGTITRLETAFQTVLSSILDRKILKVQFSKEEALNNSVNQTIVLLKQIANKSDTVKIDRIEDMVDALEELNPLIKNLVQSSAVSSAEQTGDLLDKLTLLQKAFDIGNINDKESIGLLTKINASFAPITKTLTALAKKDIKLPEKQVVSGSVAVTSLPALEQLTKVIDAINALRQDLAKPQKKEEVKAELAEGKAIAEKLQEISDKLTHLPDDMPLTKTVEVTNFPPQKYPNPVTNMSINGLGGLPLATPVTLTQTPQALPSNALTNRRSMIIYNSSSSTVYIGGATVTSSTGLPIPASSYSPALDAGDQMVIYGVVATGSAIIRVLELSDIRTGR